MEVRFFGVVEQMNETNNHLSAWITEKFIAAAPQAAAKSLAALATHEAVLLLKPLKAEYIIACLDPMPADKAAAILRRLPSRQSAYVLARLDLRQGAEVFAAFSSPQREKMKTLLPASVVHALQARASWPEGSAGALMNTDFLMFKTEAKLTEMIEKLKLLPRKKLPPACLVTARDGKLKGMIRTGELAFYASSSTAGSIMTPVQSLHAQIPAREAQKILEDGQPLVPVTDENGIPLGILTEKSLLVGACPSKKRFGWF